MSAVGAVVPAGQGGQVVVREARPASAELTAPRGSEGRYVDGLRDECGLVISRVLTAVRVLTGRDLLRELLEPLAGDIEGISTMQDGWRRLAAASEAVAANWDGLDAQLAPVWTGRAADRAHLALRAEAARAARQAEASALVADQLGHLVEVARSTAETVCAALEFLDACVQDLVLSAGGPVGWARAAAKAPGKVQRIVSLVQRAVEALEGLRRAVRACLRVLALVEASLDGATTVLGAANDVGHAVAAAWVDETARAGFGP